MEASAADASPTPQDLGAAGRLLLQKPACLTSKSLSADVIALPANGRLGSASLLGWQ
jgi:hypothetical protein